MRIPGGGILGSTWHSPIRGSGKLAGRREQGPLAAGTGIEFTIPGRGAKHFPSGTDRRIKKPVPRPGPCSGWHGPRAKNGIVREDGTHDGVGGLRCRKPWPVLLRPATGTDEGDSGNGTSSVQNGWFCLRYLLIFSRRVQRGGAIARRKRAHAVRPRCVTRLRVNRARCDSHRRAGVRLRRHAAAAATGAARIAGRNGRRTNRGRRTRIAASGHPVEAAAPRRTASEHRYSRQDQ